MRKILMRAHMSPLSNPDFMELSSKDLIGSNIGNLLFANSVYRTIMTDDTQIDCIKINRVFSEEEVERFNNEYDCFVIPLANAFRPDFLPELNRLTLLIEELNIPCVVVGVGIQEELTSESIGGYPFDEDVKRFINCVLDKSTIIGLRGEYTACYLEYLGYKPEKDFTIIGCPSMYLYGGKLPNFQKKELTPESVICFNSSLANIPQLQSFMERNLQLLKNYYYVPQILDEMRAMYLGIPFPEGKYSYIPSYYPSSFANPIYTNGYGIGFLNLNSWLEFLSHMDFSFGTKIHGNIAAIVSGTPSYIIASDIRVQELAQFHYIPYTTYNELSEDTTIFDLYEKADYGPMFSHHLGNFHHYLEFLNANQIPHIYQEKDFVEECPFDKKMREIKFNPPIQAFSNISAEEQAQRLKLYYEYLDEQKKQQQENVRKLKIEKTEEQKKLKGKIQGLERTIDNQKEQIYNLKKTTEHQKKKIQKLKNKTENQKKELDHKSVQMIIKLRKRAEKMGIKIKRAASDSE